MSMLYSAAACSMEFNKSFLKKRGASAVDLKYFETGNGIMPGTYSVDILINQALWKRQDIAFIATEDAEVAPQLSLGLLRDMGVDIQRLERDAILLSDSPDDMTVNITAIPGASTHFDLNNLELQVSIPQLYISRNSRSYVDASLWDQGITAFYSNYQSNFSRNTTAGTRNDYGYVGLHNGLNIGAWRLRNDSAISGSSAMAARFNSNRTYIERDLTSLQGKLSLGELYTAGDIFDSVRFRGVQVGSDIGMLPDNEIGYAPVVRGIAETNATVEVRQNGYLIHSSSVSPGAFEITDIYPGGSNGDLEVTIIEADGRERKYSQAYSFLPVMIRRGSLRYNLAAGEYHNSTQASPSFSQGTLVYGLSENFTGYGGVLSAEQYQAVNLGVGLNTPIGGMSLDATNSRSETPSGKKTGQSARFLFSKTFSRTDTTFTMVGYRYSTEGYRTFGQHVDALEYIDGSLRGQQKSRLDLNINQTVGRSGSVFVNAGETSYWSGTGRTRRYQMGYSSSLYKANYSLAVSSTENAGIGGRQNSQFTASISLPLGSSARSARLYTSAVASQQGDSSVQSGVSGYLDEQNTLNYNVQAGYSRDSDTSGSFGLGWDNRYSSLSGTYSRSRDSTHYDLGASGAVVVHGGGVTLGQSVGETFALVEVPGVEGVGLNSSSSVVTDRSGYAIANYVQPYRRNWLSVETSTLGSEVELENTSQQVVPRRGAIVHARFAAESGRRVQFELTRENAESIPFGAMARDQDGKNLGVVDNLSRLLAFGIKDSGQLKVEWKDGSCLADYTLPQRDKENAYDRIKTVCHEQNM